MKVYIKHHPSNAGKWIYEGYKNAWEYLGYQVIFYNSLDEIETTDEHFIMAVDSDFFAKHEAKIKKSKKTFLYVQPNTAPMHWGSHPNFYSTCEDKNIINSLDQALLWTFADQHENFYSCWRNPKTIPLAYDNTAYKSDPLAEQYDVCFVGGIANNGFNEKFEIMVEILKSFEGSNLNVAFFVNSNLSHQQENDLFRSSKVSLNIHDKYQRVLGADTNERTFKSLGANGLLVSDNVKQLSRLFPNVSCSNDPEEIIDIIKQYCSLSARDRLDIKNENKEEIIKNHTYIQRVKEMLSYV